MTELSRELVMLAVRHALRWKARALALEAEVDQLRARVAVLERQLREQRS